SDRPRGCGRPRTPAPTPPPHPPAVPAAVAASRLPRLIHTCGDTRHGLVHAGASPGGRARSATVGSAVRTDVPNGQGDGETWHRRGGEPPGVRAGGSGRL